MNNIPTLKILPVSKLAARHNQKEVQSGQDINFNIKVSVKLLLNILFEKKYPIYES